ncbi:MAG: hypothetical protein COA52_04690 [Hyphomicrobiales bacterium]|nr:MAG: hypothetical protein COA52_04690 [Hyphomicrobiales bacterium]
MAEADWLARTIITRAIEADFNIGILRFGLLQDRDWLLYQYLNFLFAGVFQNQAVLLQFVTRPESG